MRRRSAKPDSENHCNGAPLISPEVRRMVWRTNNDLLAKATKPELRVRSKINSDFAGGYLACWRGARCFRTGTTAYPQQSVRSEQRSQQAKEPQPGGAGRRR